MNIHPAVLRAIQEIDAAILSSDEFMDKKNIRYLENYVDLWKGRLNANKLTFDEIPLTPTE